MIIMIIIIMNKLLTISHNDSNNDSNDNTQ